MGNLGAPWALNLCVFKMFPVTVSVDLRLK